MNGIGARPNGVLKDFAEFLRLSRKYLGTKLLITIVGALCGGWWLTAKFIYIPNALNLATDSLSEAMGFELRTDGWSVDFGEGVLASSNWVLIDPDQNSVIAEIPSIKINFSGFRYFKSWSLKQSISSMTIERPVLTLHRALDGRWNWQAAFESRHMSAFIQDALQSEAADDDDVVIFDLIKVDEMSINWVETMPVQNTGTVMTERTARIDIDDVELRANDFQWPFNQNIGTQRVRFNGRIGSGKMALNASGRFLNWEQSSSGSKSPGFANLLWHPEIDGTIILDSVGADSFTQMIPEPDVIAVSGTFAGETKFAVSNRTFLALDSNLNVRDVKWSTVESGTSMANLKLDPITFSSQGYASVSGLKGDLGDDKFKPVYTLLSAVAEDAVRSGPEELQFVAANQAVRYESGLQSDSVARQEARRSSQVQQWLKNPRSFSSRRSSSRSRSQQVANTTADNTSANTESAQPKKKGLLGKTGGAIGRAFGGAGKAAVNAGKGTLNWMEKVSDD